MKPLHFLIVNLFFLVISLSAFKRTFKLQSPKSDTTSLGAELQDTNINVNMMV